MKSRVRNLILSIVVGLSATAPGQTTPVESDPHSAWVEDASLPLLPPSAYDAAMPRLGLSNIVIFCVGGHGLTADDTDSSPKDGDFGWYTQRPLTHGMIEDFGNADQHDFFAHYALNAGAMVVPLRPIGFQPNEVVLDNSDAQHVTFEGTWKIGKAPIHFGSSAEPYRYAVTSENPTARVIYRPEIPETGFYPVYTWVFPGADRVPQRYRIHYAGGMESRIVNHRRVGRGWVWLGTYYFEKGTTGYVEIDNRSVAAIAGHGVVVADAIRFGNGIGDINRGAGTSGFPREFEASRYWVENMAGTGSPSFWDIPNVSDQGDNVSAPAKMAALMNREAEGHYFERLYVSFHTNASGTRRGALALFNEQHPTVRQRDYATVLHDALDRDLALLHKGNEFRGEWVNTAGKTYGGINYGEIRNSSVNGEFTATIMEVAYHDKAEDAYLLKQPAFRNAAARGTYKGMVEFLQTVQEVKVPATILPDPPRNVRVFPREDGSVEIAWETAVMGAVGGGVPERYFIWGSTNGHGYARLASVDGGNATRSTPITGDASEMRFFRVTASNRGGESFPSLPAVHRGGDGGRWLLVNAIPAFHDADLPVVTMESNAGSTRGGPATVSVLRRTITHQADALIATAQAMQQNGLSFTSITRDSALSGAINFADYAGVVWIDAHRREEKPEVLQRERRLLSLYLTGENARLLSLGSALPWQIVEAMNEPNLARSYNLNIPQLQDNGQRGSVVPGAGTAFDGLVPFDVALDRLDVFSTHSTNRRFPSGHDDLRTLSVYTRPFGGLAGAESVMGNARMVSIAVPITAVVEPGARAELIRAAIEHLGKQP